MVLRLKVKDIKQAGRATRGSRIMEVKEGDRISSIARIATQDLAKAGVATQANGDKNMEAGEQYKMPIE